MTVPAEVRGRFYALRALAAALCLFAAAAIYLRAGSYEFLLLGLAAISLGMWLVRRSNVYVTRARGQVAPNLPPTKGARRAGLLAWMFTALSLVACVGFYLTARVDALHGGKEAWPAYALFAAVLALAASSGYVAMKIFR